MTKHISEYRMVETFSKSLQNQRRLQSYLDKGFTHIRRVICTFKQILRFPTVGCRVELSNRYEVGSYPILSAAGKNLIWRLNYF